MSGLRIAAIRLLCPDPAHTASFYAEAFGARADGAGAVISVTLGQGHAELAPTASPRSAPAPSNATSFQHFAIVVSDMKAAMAQLDGVRGWSAISRAGPERLPASSGGATAFKFRDPDGHPLELLQFAEAALPERWAGRPGLFLGIDHTAITVADTEHSVAFYSGLGFRVSSRGVNRGIEQERLDDVQDPVVEITGLTPPGGAPHLELLCYRVPPSVPVTLDDDAVLATRTILTEGRSGTPDTQPAESIDPDGHRLMLG